MDGLSISHRGCNRVWESRKSEPSGSANRKMRIEKCRVKFKLTCNFEKAACNVLYYNDLCVDKYIMRNRVSSCVKNHSIIDGI